MQRLATAVFLLIALCGWSHVSACQAEGPGGPDVIVGDPHQLRMWASIDGKSAFSVGTVSCNIGDTPLEAPSPSLALIGFFKPGRPGYLDVEVRAPACPADCDRSGSLDVLDFLCFQDAFASGSSATDCTGDTRLDVFDFLCFQDLFASA